MTDRARKALTYLQEKGWMGEAGASLIVGAIAFALLHMSGVDTPVWGIPVSLVGAGALSTGLFFLLASLRAIPSRDD